MKTRIFTLFIVSVCLFACKKEEVPETGNGSVTETNATLEALVSHGWKFDYQFYSVVGDTLFPYLTPDCLRDDSLVYRKDGLYLKYAGNNLCSPSNNPIDTLNWELHGDTALVTENQGVFTEKRIMILNEDSLMLSSISPTKDTLAFLYLKY